MQWSIEQYLMHLGTFGLVLVRISALMAIAPLFGTFEVPARVRALLVLAMCLLIVPLQAGRVTHPPDTLVGFLVLAGGEALVGITLGLGVRILFSSMQVAGQIISQMSGLQLADVFSPGFSTSMPLFSHLLLGVTTAMFLLIGGHRRVMEALLDTFVWLPAGEGRFSQSAVEATTSLLAQSFELGVRAAAPAMVALLLATLILGLISRTLPQLNVMALGFSINAVVVLLALGLSLGGACWIFQDQLEPTLETVLAALKAQ